ncbi:fatty acid synthase-like [Neocloeon triangulifer]|uniref:fatty acid synthase-like n=1 Tax=Neocloeon triangulifer TaxID=2078957 RepID=UPI00286F193A|nr:fatty acid synthase-like [Neocloeon triangulifer]
MAPPPALDGNEDIVISGMSGRFPESGNVYEFRDNLYNKVDMITQDARRWDIDHNEIPRRIGKIRDLEKFDASFFAVHYKQAQTMDPMCRILLELAYEAIVDAGVNPASLRGSKCGVFVGACFSETEKIWFYEKIQIHGFGITGCSRAMLANRISYWLGIHGPSYSVDTACSSSLYAMDHAVRSIRSGECDAALVGGSNLTLHPFISLQFARLGVLSPEGKCKSFDASANGYVRSETVAMVFLQKAKDSRRIYATVVHTKTNCDGFKEQGITYPSGALQGVLLADFYKECRVPPEQLAYLEAHGTGTKVGDPEELNTIDRVLCANRKEPLLVGSVKSNIGHSEPASALSSIIKVVIGFENGKIPPNLHFKNPRPGIPALAEGRIKVVSEVTPWTGGYVGINSFGFGGANAHCLLRSHQKEKPKTDPAELDGLPRIVLASGRTLDAVETILAEFEKRAVDSEYVALENCVHEDKIAGHLYRGFAVLPGAVPAAGAAPQKAKLRDAQHFPGAKRPVWFVFAGMGSQWVGMGRDLLRVDAFARAIDRCDAVLRPKGVDIRRIITDDDPKTFDNILNSFVGIAAVQVGLVDVLREAGVEPDGIIGHSVGELGCAYADGCMSGEQMVLAAYCRGLASLETPLIRGSMAAVGLSYEMLAPLCPGNVDVACLNGTDSCTISGPADSVAAFVAELKAKEVFAREVACANIAYHSRYIADAGPTLLKYLTQVVPERKARSAKWVSSSVPQARWDREEAKFSSPEYHTNNLLCPVLFAQALTHLPKDAITIEIAPHGLLQAILRRSLGPECTNIALTQRGAPNALEVLFNAFGRMFVAGIQPKVNKLMPPVEFPVSRGTPMISPLVRWQHSDDWHVAIYKNESKLETGERTVAVDLQEEDNIFLTGHCIDGRILFPATGYLFLAWETFALMSNKMITDVPIVFENVKFLRATNVPKDGAVTFTIMVTKGTGHFEVVESGSTVVTGRLSQPENVAKEQLDLPPATPTNDQPPLLQEDVYKELRLRGYNYAGIFKGIKCAHSSGESGTLFWEDNWVAFMDALLQVEILQLDSRSLYVPTALQKLTIDPKKHLDLLKDQQLLDDQTKAELGFAAFRKHEVLQAGGVEIRGVQASVIARRKPKADPLLETYQLVPYRPADVLSDSAALRVCAHVALENSMACAKLKVVEWVPPIETNANCLLTLKLPTIFADLPMISAEITLFGAGAVLTETLTDGNMLSGVTLDERRGIPRDSAANLMTCGEGSTMLLLPEVFADAVAATLPRGFIILQLKKDEWKDAEAKLQNLGCLVISVVPFNDEDNEDEEEGVFVLARKMESSAAQPDEVKGKDWVIHIPESQINFGENLGGAKFEWVGELQEALASDPPPHRVYLVSQHAPLSGIMGLVNCLARETQGDIVRCVFVLDEAAPEFSVEAPFYAEQLRKDLLVNVAVTGEGWSSFRHLPLECETALVSHAYVNVMTRGDLSSFKWLQGPLSDLRQDFGAKNLYHVYFSALNFRDVMTATGKLAVEVIAPDRRSQDCVQGLEFSGRDADGNRVMGLVSSGALANVVLADPLLVWDVPSEWTLEEAATVPAVYCTVYYALVVRGRMRAGESLLVHAGSGGVGQAAIHVALHMGCDVFVTVGTKDKLDFIRATFPQIPEANIGNSRDTSFEQMVMERTDGKGVDLVLNSLAGDKLLASVRCLAMHGRFLEIGKVDMAADSAIGMHCLLKDISIHGVLLDSIIEGTLYEKKRLREMFAHGMRSGAIKPLVRQVFGPDQVEKAFRFMAAGKHIGKVLLRIRAEEVGAQGAGLRPKTHLVEAIPRFFCEPSKSYVLVGGLGGFGLELADWLVLRGATKLVLASRTGLRTGYQASRIARWNSYGVQVVISRADVSCEQGCVALVQQAAKMGPVAAVFNLAVVLCDALFANQSEESVAVALVPKACTTRLLDKVTRRLCPKLQHFVVFSSVSCGRGNPGQTNYGLANSVMERVCEQRRRQGLPALAVQWGAVADVGLIADNMVAGEGSEPVIGGTIPQRITSCLAVLDTFLCLPQDDSQPAVVSSMVVAEKSKKSNASGSVVDTVGNILGLKDLKTVSLHSTLAELGMDSMMAVEIKQTLEREFEMFLSAQDIRGLTFAKLTELAQSMQEEFRNRNKDLTAEDNLWMVGGLQHLLSVVGEPEKARQAAIVLSTDPEVTDRRTLFMVPGVEGLAWVMEPLAKQLHRPVVCLQLPLDAPSHAVPDLANILLQRLTEVQPQGPYHLLGYSYGTIPLMEAVLRLQEQGYEVKVVLVDGSLASLQAVARTGVSGASDAEWQANFLEKLMLIVGVTDAAKVASELVGLADWEARLAATAAHFPDETQREFHALCVDAVQKRCTQLLEYAWPEGRKVTCPVTLIRTTQGFAAAEPDYGLSQLCDSSVTVHQVEGSHIGIVHNQRTAEIINNEAFK